jgi:hypothetical protein
MEDEHLRGDSPQDHHRLTPVDLRLNTGIVHQGNHPRRGLTQLPAAVGHPLAHRTLRNLRAVLLGQALPDAVRGMALLSRCRAICDQPPVDQLPILPELRRRTALRPLARRRHRRRERFPDSATVNSMARCQSPDRQALAVAIPSYLLERLHS